MVANVAYFGPASTLEEALDRLKNFKGAMAVDTETIGLKGDKSVTIPDWDDDGNPTDRKAFMDARTLIGIGVALSPTEAFYFPVGRGHRWKNVPDSDPYPLLRKLTEPGVLTVLFNAMFDIDRIDDAFDITVENFACTAVASQVQGLWNSLDQNSGHLLGETHQTIDDVLPKGKTMLDVDFKTTAWKCMMDCVTTLKLYNLYRMGEWDRRESLTWTDHVGRQFTVSPEIIKCYDVDIRTMPILRKMSKHGFAVKRHVVERWYTKLQTEIQQYDYYFSRWGINAMSNDQVGWLMSKRGNYVPLTEGKKHLKVNEEVLLAMHDPVAHMVLARRRRQKLKGTYVEPFRGVDRAYTHFRLDLATGRLGSWDFNAQNFPPVMHEIFEPDSGFYTVADFQQAELRVWAHQAQDPVMLEAFRQGSSPHEATLHALFPGKPKKNPDGSSTKEYVDSKGYNFSLLADANAETQARTTKLPIEVVRKYTEELYQLYWKSREHQAYMRVRHQPDFYPDYVEDDYGRRCHIPDGIDVTYTHQEKCRLNYPFQATVASMMKRGMIGLDAIGMVFPCQIHDNIVQDGTAPFPKWLTELHPTIEMPVDIVPPSPVWL